MATTRAKAKPTRKKAKTRPKKKAAKKPKPKPKTGPWSSVAKMIRLPKWLADAVQAEANRSAANGAFSKQVEYELKQVGDAIEPILIVGVGIIVLVMALGVYLPMWDLSKAAHGGG